MLATMFFFVSMDTLAKQLVETYPAAQVVWARYIFHMALLAVLLNRRFAVHLRTGNLKLQLFRSALLIVTTGFFFLGLRHNQLVVASSIMFLGPILVTALSAPLLKEPVGIRRWAGVVAGFVGAIVILRPGTEVFQLTSLLPLAAACSYSLYQITTRRLAQQKEPPVTTLCYTALLGAVVMSVVAPFDWKPPTAEVWAIMVLIGVIGGVGHFTLIKAFENAPAATITPFGYSSIIWATAYGFAVFGDLPDLWTAAGAAIIILSGLYIFHREQVRAQRLASAAKPSLAEH